MKQKKLRIALLVAAALLAVTVGISALYLSDYYPADEAAVAAFLEDGSVEEIPLYEGAVAFGDPSAKVGLIFYPGGKVDAAAYEPLLRALSEEGILTVLLEMPFRLAVMDVNAADGIRERFPDVANWYMAGHSLGGSMAAAYLSDRAEDFRGLILLGAYSTADLSRTNLSVLSLYGSEDGVMNREKYEKYKGNLPEGFTETVLEGGCHAYFGMYGTQDGDGTPSLSNEEQIRQTVKAIVQLTKESAYAEDH